MERLRQSSEWYGITARLKVRSSWGPGVPLSGQRLTRQRQANHGLGAHLLWSPCPATRENARQPFPFTTEGKGRAIAPFLFDECCGSPVLVLVPSFGGFPMPKLASAEATCPSATRQSLRPASTPLLVRSEVAKVSGDFPTEEDVLHLRPFSDVVNHQVASCLVRFLVDDNSDVRNSAT